MDSPSSEGLGISVVIPSYNSEKTILETLKGLQGQEAKDFEVIVVDDGSTDSSPELVAQFGHQSSLALKLIRQPNSGPAKARNLGVQLSQGRVVIFLDSDCIPPPNWVQEMVRPLNGERVGCYCGYKVRNERSLIARYIDLEIAWRQQRLKGKNIDTIASYSASIIRNAFLKLGGFDTSFTAPDAEDFDLSFKLRRSGHGLAFTDRTFVYHYHPQTLKRYLHQQYSRGYWRVKLYLENRDKILRGDSYTGHEPQIQFVLSNLALLSLPLMLLYPALPLLGFGLLWLSNTPLGWWAFRKEKKFLLLAPLLASLRSLVGTLGVYRYGVKNMLLPTMTRVLRPRVTSRR